MKLEPRGLEPLTSCMPCRRPVDVNPCGTTTDAPPEGGRCTPGCTNSPETGPDTAEMPDDLAVVVAAWPDLPEPIRAGILAMVKSMGAQR